MAGADGVELDCRMAGDGRWWSATTTICRAEANIPTLDEALDTLDGLHVMVELKSQPGRTEAFSDVVAEAPRQRRGVAGVITDVPRLF